MSAPSVRRAIGAAVAAATRQETATVKRRAAVPRRSARVGSLRGNLGALSVDLQRLCVELSVVWADDMGDIHVTPATEAQIIPLHWIVGTFSLGANATHFEEDLVAMRAERSEAWSD